MAKSNLQHEEALQYWLELLQRSSTRLEKYHNKSFDYQIINYQRISLEIEHATNYINIAIYISESLANSKIQSQLDQEVKNFEEKLISLKQIGLEINKNFAEFNNLLDSTLNHAKDIVSEKKYDDIKDFFCKMEKFEEYKAVIKATKHGGMINQDVKQLMSELYKYGDIIYQIYTNYLLTELLNDDVSIESFDHSLNLIADYTTESSE